MTYQQFLASTSNDNPPPAYSPLLKAMWYDAKDKWHEAHNIAQDIHSKEGSWIHAYLHRKEGDISNARYWYNRAGKHEFTDTLEAEREQIVKALLHNDMDD